MKYVWENLPKRLSCFTVRNASMVNLGTGKIVRRYSANTKINVVQKCVTPTATYYRTAEAAENHLNYAFEASAFGLPNEPAPSEPSKLLEEKHSNSTPAPTPRPVTKQKVSQKVASSKDGEEARRQGLLRRLLRRMHG